MIVVAVVTRKLDKGGTKYGGGFLKKSSRGQQMIIEHILLSAAALIVLASVSLMFYNVNTRITDMQAEYGLLSVGEQIALGIVSVYEKANSSIVPTNVTIMLDLPATIVGRSYEAVYASASSSAGTVDVIRVVGANKRVDVEFRKPVGVGIHGVITSSTSRKAMIKYIGNTNNITLGVI